MRGFVKVNVNNLAKIKDLSASELGLLLLLSGNIKYNTNLLTTSDGSPLKQIHFSEITGIDAGNISRYFKKLISLGIIRKVIYDGKQYFAINNELFAKG